MPGLRIKRGTRAQLDAAASANQLHAGEPYLITDEARLAIGTAADAYIPAALATEATGPRITVNATAPASPAVGDIWIEV